MTNTHWFFWRGQEEILAKPKPAGFPLLNNEYCSIISNFVPLLYLLETGQSDKYIKLEVRALVGERFKKTKDKNHSAMK